MTIDAVAILEKLERDHAQMGRDIAALRRTVLPAADAQHDLITDWIDTAAAADIAGRSVARMTTLCRENPIEVPGGFAKKFGGRHRASASLLRSYLRDHQKK